MRKILGYTAVASLAFVNMTCKKGTLCDCFKGTGEVIEETRSVPLFHNIYVTDNVNVIFTEDSVETVTVEAGKHLMKQITTDVQDDCLNIHNTNTCNFVRSYKVPINVYIHAPRNIYHITSKGSGLITNTDVCTADSLDLDAKSSGDIEFTVNSNTIYTHQTDVGDVTLHGHANNVIIYTTATGFTLTDDCTNGYTWVYTRSTGKVTTDASGLLIAEVAGSGNVYYKTPPAQMQVQLENQGKVLPE